MSGRSLTGATITVVELSAALVFPLLLRRMVNTTVSLVRRSNG